MERSSKKKAMWRNVEERFWSSVKNEWEVRGRSRLGMAGIDLV